MTSCAKKEMVRPPVLEPHTGPVTVDLLKRSIGFRDIRTVKALTDVRLYNHGEPSDSLSGFFGYQAPDNLKASFFGPFGMTVMDVLFVKDLLQVYLPRKEILYEMISPEISFSSVADGRFRYEMREHGDYYVLAACTADSPAVPVMIYLFDRTYLLNRQIVVFKGGHEAMMIEFDGFDGKAPNRLKVSFSNGTAIEMTLKEAEYDTDVPPEYFRPVGHADKRVLPFQELLKHVDPMR